MSKELKYDENGQVIETTDPTPSNPDPKVDPKVDPKADPKVDPTDPKADPKVDPKEEPKVKTFTEEELNKQIQSASSKAKGEILTALGIKSVEEGKEKIANASFKTKYEELEQEHNNLKANHTARENELLVEKLGIAKEHAETFIQLVDADTSEIPREEKAKKIKETMIAMFGGSIKIGTEKTPGSQVQEEANKNAIRSAFGLKTK